MRDIGRGRLRIDGNAELQMADRAAPPGADLVTKE